MKIEIVSKTRQAKFCIEKTAFSGVKKIANKVLQDVTLVSNQTLELTETLPEQQENTTCVMIATIGHSAYVEQLEKEGIIDLSQIRGKREVYLFQILAYHEKQLLLIAGSDKRGTIYGLFHLSELMGVSPWVYFADVMPKKQEEIILEETVNMVSKEPSVKYRGFFINDEWPSFGNWTFRHFDGFTTKMYDHVFELLLRLKGNYLWPAMWTSNFSLDGPGFTNAQLADEYGIVMSNSHHEPCLRHSEEWDLVKGEQTPYGKDWNFDKNKAGLTNYWRDGLKRNGTLENIITMGMRGERDSEILGHTASLQENVDYLKEVITTQNELIKECVNEKLEDVPRMLALYKEVEAYFYGDEHTKGLKEWKELDGITLMLCEDNFGNMRTLPTQENRNRKGGWGMYYHFDYHGDPVSYEWVNSTYLPKVWEQMTMAYEYGIRDIWIVNVGDLKPQELPLSYFLDLAYDFDKWGTKAPNSTQAYTREWVAKQFGACFTQEECAQIFDLLEAYTRQNHISKPEALRIDTYHPVYLGKSDALLETAKKQIAIAKELLDKITKRCQEEEKNQPDYAAFYQLVYYPTVASFTQLQLMLFAGKNKLYAKQGKVIANAYAEKMKQCIAKDKMLRDTYHQLMNGKWDGIMMSEHIGFAHWNDEECAYPTMHEIIPANKPRLVVSPTNAECFTMGGDWTRKNLKIYDFVNPTCKQVSIDLANGSSTTFDCKVDVDADWICVSSEQLRIELQQQLIVTIDRNKLPKAKKAEAFAKATIKIETVFCHVLVEVYAALQLQKQPHVVPVLPENAQVAYEETNAFLQIDVSHYTEIKNTQEGQMICLNPFGKYQAGIKAMPVTKSFIPAKNAPAVTYTLELLEDGVYEITIFSAPSNPLQTDALLRFGCQWNKEEIELVNTVNKDYHGGERSCMQWAVGVIENIHKVTVLRQGKKGKNTITIYACDPAFVLEGMEIRKK